MNGYSKIKLVNNKSAKSRSIDLSDLLSFPENPKIIENISPNHTPKIQETNHINTPNTHESSAELEDEDGKGERFGEMLSRNCSVSSTASHRFRFEKQSTLQTAVKRAFSMRRSSSVSERYCRIHDQSVTLASPIDGDDTMLTRSIKKRHRTSKILKACISFRRDQNLCIKDGIKTLLMHKIHELLDV